MKTVDVKLWVKCDLCGTPFCPDVYDKKIFGYQVCMWCYGRNGKSFAAHRAFVEAATKLPCEYADIGLQNCRCFGCRARRVKAIHDER